MSKKLKFFIQSQWEIFRGDWLGKAGVAILACFILMAIFAPLVAPHRPDEMIYSDGKLVRLQPPTWKHLFGTTQMGQDIFSQVIYGSRAAALWSKTSPLS
jgi:peptide/nickel transport system permease protein